MESHLSQQDSDQSLWHALHGHIFALRGFPRPSSLTCRISVAFKTYGWEVEEHVIARPLMCVSAPEARCTSYFIESCKGCATQICFCHSKTSPSSSIVHFVFMHSQLTSPLGEGDDSWGARVKEEALFSTTAIVSLCSKRWAYSPFRKMWVRISTYHMGKKKGQLEESLAH